MGSCCGRPNNRASKDVNYYNRFAYLSSHQRELAQKAGALGKCNYCDALTSGEPCSICGNPKVKKEEQA